MGDRFLCVIICLFAREPLPFLVFGPPPPWCQDQGPTKPQGMACEPFRATVTFKPVYAKLVSGSSAEVPPGLAWNFFLDRDIFFDGDIFSLTGIFFL